MAKIESIKAREVLDSRGNPTVEAQVLVDKLWYRAMVPSGASTGKHEAVELRDKQKRYNKKGVQKAVHNVNKIIAKKLKGMNVTQQKLIDGHLLTIDGTKQKKKMGANAMLAVSLACARAGAAAEGVHLFTHLRRLAKKRTVTLPVPMMNVINGGEHAGQKNDIQEHMILPIGAKSYKEGLRMGTETFHELGSILKKKFGAQGKLVGDEGGYVPPVKTVVERLKLVEKAIVQAGYKPGKDMVFALDVAASEFYNQKKKQYMIGRKVFTAKRLQWYYEELCEQFPLVSLEDPFAEDDWKAWQAATKDMGKKVDIVGDDLLVTNPERIRMAIKKKACNALLLKVNQIGTLTQALHAGLMAQAQKWQTIVSHRSGETEDAFIADLAVGINAKRSKFGAPCRSDRVAKYNELLRIEEALGRKATYG